MHANRLRLNRVRELRRNRSMTQAQLARRAQVALRTVQSIERGLGCRRDTMRKLLRALEVPFETWNEVFLMTPVPSTPLEIGPRRAAAPKRWRNAERESYLDSNA